MHWTWTAVLTQCSHTLRASLLVPLSLLIRLRSWNPNDYSHYLHVAHLNRSFFLPSHCAHSQCWASWLVFHFSVAVVQTASRLATRSDILELRCVHHIHLYLVSYSWRFKLRAEVEWNQCFSTFANPQKELAYIWKHGCCVVLGQLFRLRNGFHFLPLQWRFIC